LEKELLSSFALAQTLFLREEFSCKSFTTEQEQRIIEDPQYCDRVLVCPSHNVPGFVRYCPKGQVFDPRIGKDFNCTSRHNPSAAQRCLARKVLQLETPGKPDEDCEVDKVLSEEYAVHKINNGIGHFKLSSDFQRAYHFCPAGHQKAFTLECIDPMYPDVVLDVNGNRKCFPKGALRLHKQSPNKCSGSNQKHCSSRVSYNGMPIMFSRQGFPICPTIEAVKNAYGFGPASRFQHDSDCVHFWTCDDNNYPHLSSCPKGHVFDRASEQCVFVKDAKAPCNKAFDSEDEESLQKHQAENTPMNLFKEGRRHFDEAKAREEYVYALNEMIKTADKMLRMASPGSTTYLAIKKASQDLRTVAKKVQSGRCPHGQRFRR